MKLALLAILFCGSAVAQNVNGQYTVIGSTAQLPATCSPTQTWLLMPSGVLYTCQNGTPTQVSGGGGGSGTVSGQSVNCIPKASSATALTGCSSASDDGTFFTIAEIAKALSFVGTGTDPSINMPSNTTHSFSSGDIVNNAGNFQVGIGTAVGALAVTVGSGSVTVNPGAIGAGACSAAIPLSAPTVLTSDSAFYSYTGDVTGTTGYVPGASLTLVPYPTVGSINVKACNSTLLSITPTAINLNVFALRPGSVPQALSVKQGFSGVLAATGTVVSSNAFSSSTGDSLALVTRLGAASPTNCSTASASVADTAGDTFIAIGSPFPDPGGLGYCLQRFRAFGITGNASNVVTVTWNQSSPFNNIWGLEMIGVSAVDATPTGGGGTNGATTGTFTTTFANEILFSCVGTAATGNTFTAGSGFTLNGASKDSSSVGQCQYQIVSAIQTGVTMSITSAVASTSLLGASFR